MGHGIGVIVEHVIVVALRQCHEHGRKHTVTRATFKRSPQKCRERNGPKP